jgi:hypothetical protein
MTRYRFTSFWAALHVVGGLALLALSLLLAALVLTGHVSFGLALDEPTFPAARFVLGTAVAFLGLLVAGPSIVAGQLLQIFLDQRRLLRLVYRRLRAIDLREREREAVERAQQRKGRRSETL